MGEGGGQQVAYRSFAVGAGYVDGPVVRVGPAERFVELPDGLDARLVGAVAHDLV